MVDLAESARLDSIDKSLSPAALAVRRFRKHRMAVFGMILLVGIVFYVTLSGPFLKGYCAPIEKEVRGEAWANCNDTGKKLLPPSREHPFGTDVIGRDILARTVYGGQISVMIGIFAVCVEILIGTTIGATAAYYGGWLDSILMRFTEAMLIIPNLFLLIIGARFMGSGLPDVNIFGRQITSNVFVIILIIGATSWMYTARIIRANILSLREMDLYCRGARHGRIGQPHHLHPSAAQHHSPFDRWRHPGRCRRDYFRSLRQFSRAGRAGRDRDLG